MRGVFAFFMKLFTLFSSFKQACVNFVKWNFETVATSEQFADFDVEVLLYFLQQDDLVVQDEVSLYK